MQQPIYEVSQINEYIKLRFDDDAFLNNLFLRGEISNYKCYPSGHHYFSLKDAGGSIRCVMFRGSAFSLRFRPENGMKVIAQGRISVFPRDGTYQFYVNQMTVDGVGDLHVAFEQLKAKLLAEGLFDPSRKRPLPRYPHTIAIITSSAGAALRDMLRILRKRYPLCEVKLLPVRVQGEEAPGEIAAALAYANRYRVADLIITGRGGGSMEDLWAFNDERVARAIYESEIPVISAVGHEPDVTISDYVADRRAATPSNAAEIAVPDRMEVRDALEGRGARLSQAMRKKLESLARRLEDAAARPALRDPEVYLANKRMALDYGRTGLAAAFEKRLEGKKRAAATLAAKLDALSPLKVLERGYSIAQKDGKTLRRAAEVSVGDAIDVRLPDGRLGCIVQEVGNDGREKL